MALTSSPALAFMSFSVAGMDLSRPLPTPGMIQRPTLSANSLDGELMPRASFAASSRLLARLLTLFVSQFQPELMPFQSPLTMLLPTSLILSGRDFSPLTTESKSCFAAAAPLLASSVPQLMTLFTVLTRCVQTFPGSSCTMLLILLSMLLMADEALLSIC